MNNMNSKGQLLVVSGPSGAGKGTICKALIDKNPIWISTSCTTRKPRAGEVEGLNYFFTEREDFLKRIDKDDFLEYAEVYGNFYGTPKSEVLKMLDEYYQLRGWDQNTGIPQSETLTELSLPEAETERVAIGLTARLERVVHAKG